MNMVRLRAKIRPYNLLKLWKLQDSRMIHNVHDIHGKPHTAKIYYAHLEFMQGKIDKLSSG